MTDELAYLTEVVAARTRLDERELELIDRARHRGATWAQLAAALGLGSRQAAEQRRQRLVAARRSRRRDLDLAYSARLGALRGAVAELAHWIEADRRWDGRFRRAALVRATVASALDADPGALHALAAYVAADLAGAPVEHLPVPVRAIATRLAALLSINS